jgi:hypothetical protein
MKDKVLWYGSLVAILLAYEVHAIIYTQSKWGVLSLT